MIAHKRDHMSESTIEWLTMLTFLGRLLKARLESWTQSFYLFVGFCRQPQIRTLRHSVHARDVTAHHSGGLDQTVFGPMGSVEIP